jgi:hypothetical protein
MAFGSAAPPSREEHEALARRVAALEARSGVAAVPAPSPLPEPESPAPSPMESARPAPVDAVAWLRARARRMRPATPGYYSTPAERDADVLDNCADDLETGEDP